jgi:hypothetical protein
VKRLPGAHYLSLFRAWTAGLWVDISGKNNTDGVHRDLDMQSSRQFYSTGSEGRRVEFLNKLNKPLCLLLGSGFNYISVDDVYGLNVSSGLAGGDKMLAPYWSPAGKVPIRTVHAFFLFFFLFFFHSKCRDSSVGVATGYGLDDRMIGGRFPPGASNFSLPHHVQTSSGAHAASYPIGTGDFFPGSKAVGAWCWPLTSI